MMPIAMLARCVAAADQELDFCLADKPPALADGPAIKMASLILGYCITHPMSAPEDVHRYRGQILIANGWERGDTLNHLERLTPLLVPYEALPEIERARVDMWVYLARTLL